jgi:hypothetical protein
MDANGLEKKAEPQMNTNARRYGPTSRQSLENLSALIFGWICSLFIRVNSCPFAVVLESSQVGN